MSGITICTEFDLPDSIKSEDKHMVAEDGFSFIILDLFGPPKVDTRGKGTAK